MTLRHNGDPTPREAADQRSTASSDNADNALFRTIFETMIDGVVVIDSRGRIEAFNPAAERMFGYTADEVRGENVKMLMPEPYRSEHDGYIGNYLSTGDAKIIGIGREVPARHKDGTEFPCDLAINEMSFAGDVRFVGTLRDISSRREAQDVIARQSHAILELSTPAIRLWDEVVLLPLVGVIDTPRAQQVAENLLDAIVSTESRVAIVDVTGVPIIDTMTAQHLSRLSAAAKMLGAEVIFTGMSPEIAQTLGRLNVDFTEGRCCGTLRAGVSEAFALLGKDVIERTQKGAP